MMTRGAFEVRYSNAGHPHEATAYGCEHGQNMVECDEGDQYHRQAGQAMLNWYNTNTFLQQRERLAVRDRLLNGE